tara:strand:- start:1825 stop:2460 length:636 start_codon:yes stop_codon:yes gene_type:complete
MKKIILISILGSLFVNCSKENIIMASAKKTPGVYIEEVDAFPGSVIEVVPNAGLVILSVSHDKLFARLNLLDNNQFISESEQIKAAHYLQYLATGLSQTDESLLSLNKVLCGIDTQQSIGDSVEITDIEKALMDELIESAIGYWSAIGATSIDGFRGNWLIRDGVLREEEDHWELTVQKKPYDILLSKMPLPFSIIKHPWMQKPLHVIWPY